jgi:hypothetical protein
MFRLRITSPTSTSRIKQTGGDWISFQTSTPTYEWRGVVPNTIYTVQVRALSANGYPSDFTLSADATTAKKTTPPAKDHATWVAPHRLQADLPHLVAASRSRRRLHRDLEQHEPTIISTALEDWHQLGHRLHA